MNGMPVSGEGEGTPIHWGCSMLLVLLVAEGLAFYLFYGRVDPDDAECLKNMVRIVNGTAAAEFVCPVSQEPYQIQADGEHQTLACPDTESHLEHHPRFVREDNRWVFQAELPEFPLAQRQTFQLRAGLREIRVEENSSEIRIQVRGAWYYRFLLGPVLALLGVALALASGGFAISIFHAHAKSAREAWTSREAMSELMEGLISALPLAAVTILSGMFLFAQARNFSNVRDLTFSKNDDSVRIQDTYFGRSWSAPRTIENIVAIYPFVAGRHREVSIIYKKEDLIEHEALFKVNPQDAALIGVFK